VNLLQVLENGLFALGQVLRLPVMALLWVCVLSALFMSGACLLDFLARRRERRGFHLDTWLKQGAVLDTTDERREQLPPSLRALVVDVAQGRAEQVLDHGGLEHFVLEREESVRATLRGSRVLVKVGPSLGLLGTLIPMGSSLAAMAAGNLEAMAGSETIREQRYMAEKIAAELEEEAA
jgi:biopolymer transport protein ExbB/TolQ